MKKNIIIMGLVSILLVTGCGCTKNEENKPNENQNVNEPTPEKPVDITDKEMTKDQTVDVLKFSNTKINYNGIMTTFDSEVTNTSDEDIILSPVVAYITYENEVGEEKTLTMDIYFGEKLKAKETRSTSNNVDIDLRKAKKIEYKIVE